MDAVDVEIVLLIIRWRAPSGERRRWKSSIRKSTNL